MKHLTDLHNALMRIEPSAEVRTELTRLVQAHDDHIELQLREARGELIRRNQIAEVISASTREGIEAVVEAVLDARQVPPGLREALEEVFSEALDAAIRRAAA